MKEPIHFTKMHALGNDFVVINALSQAINMNKELAIKMACRHTGIGCDQILLIEAPHNAEHDFFYRIFNADGHEVEQCGNGARCIGHFIHHHRLFPGNEFKVGTLNSVLVIKRSSNGNISVTFDGPNFTPDTIPFKGRLVEGKSQIELKDFNRSAHVLSVGNPHCVFFFANLDEAPVDEIGQALQSHPSFPKGVNVSFCDILARNHIRLRVYERGVGETRACGSAACASVVAGILDSNLNDEVRADLPGGALTVKWNKSRKTIKLQGPCVGVYEGVFLVDQQG